MAVKTGKDVALGCDKNIFQEVWGSDEAREDGSVAYGLESGSVFSFCTETLTGRKSGQVWGRKMLSC